MAQPKYKSIITEMYKAQPELFGRFREVHDGYVQDRKQWSQEFHSLGAKVVEVMRDYERKLCSGMNRGQYSQYTVQLADKYWEGIRKDYPWIERVGVRSNLD